MGDGQTEWLKPKEAARYFNISTSTLRNWGNQGRIETRKTPSNQHRYRVSRLEDAGTFTKGPKETKKALETDASGRFGAIYCRVSSHHQKDDLQRQIQACQEKYPTYKVYYDICSGLNYKRKGLPRLLEHVEKNMVSEVVVAHKDRLARFGVDFYQWFFSRHKTHLVFLRQDHLSPEEELTQDLMAITHVFSCRFNGKRRYQQNQQAREDQKGKGVQNRKRKTSEGSSPGSREKVAKTSPGNETQVQAGVGATAQTVPSVSSRTPSS